MAASDNQSRRKQRIPSASVRVAEARLELETNAPLWKDRKSSSCLQKISQACPAHERSRRSRNSSSSHRQITLPGFFLSHGKSRDRTSLLSASQKPLDRPKARLAQRVASQGRCERRRSARCSSQKTRPAQEETQRVESKKRATQRARSQAVPREASSATRSALRRDDCLSLSGSKGEIQGFESPVANLKEPVVSCASEIRIADASTSVESGATTACARAHPRFR